MRIVLSPAPLSSHRYACPAAAAAVLSDLACCRIHGRKRDDLDAMLQTLNLNAANPVGGGRAGGCTAPGAALAAASSCTCIPPVTLSCL